MSHHKRIDEIVESHLDEAKVDEGTINEDHMNKELIKLNAIMEKHLKAMMKDIERKTDFAEYEMTDQWEYVAQEFEETIRRYAGDFGVDM